MQRVLRRERRQFIGMPVFVVAAIALCGLAGGAAHSAIHSGAEIYEAGFRRFSLTDPVGGKDMRAVAFYPSTKETKQTKIGPFFINATINTPPATGRFPLIVISHGSGGSSLGHHDFGTYLAHRGFIVASVDHPGDNTFDHSGLGTDRVLIGRSLQMSALATAMLADPQLGAHIDARKIAAAGFSAGGYTALVMAGAKPQFGLLKDYCGTYPKDPEFCTGWSVQVTQPGLVARKDSRIKALFLMAPLAIYFNRAALADVKIPVRLFAAGDDRVLPLSANAERVQRDLPRSPEYTVIPKADHYIFLAPCSAEMKHGAPRICTDPARVDRVRVHQQVNEAAVAFFSRVFTAKTAAN